MGTRQIVVVDDHPLLAIGLCRALERSGTVVEQLDPLVGAEQVLREVADRRPDCAVVDLGLPFAGGGSALIAPLVADDIRVVVLTGESDRLLLARSLMAGAEAVISKSEPLPDIVTTILLVTDGQPVRAGDRAELMADLRLVLHEQAKSDSLFAGLSPREQQVLAGLMDGHSAASLAERHFVSMATVRAQIRSVLTKLEVGSQLEAVALAHRHRWRLRVGQS
ncbi:MAG: response regulator transcription factor [Acidimicrobiia bacterium]|nr:response regulator transcription factor [Acidimicrobiia bacterium]